MSVQLYLLLFHSFNFRRISADDDLAQFIHTVLSLLREVDSEMENINQDQQRGEFYANRLLCAVGHLTNIIVHMEHTGSHTAAEMLEIQRLRDNVKTIYTLLLQLPVMHGYAYRPQTEQASGPGRPRYLLSAEQLSCLRSEFNSWSQIAADLGVSRQTIYNRRRELGFSTAFENFTTISNADLDTVVTEELEAFPRTGETNVIAGLRQRGIYLQRWRVRESIVRVDPINRANRWGQRIIRRPYSVPHPNFLWHIDTNMKLRHWRMCIHGCVDGFSRCVIYLNVNNNNRAATVFSCFQRATTQWGHPSRVRADNGGENVAVGDYMVWFRGENRGSFLTGPSVRNTRIERLWRDVVESVVTIFTSLFMFMESHRILDPGNEIDMYALHYVFLPRVQRLLDRFVRRFNMHSVSTEHNRTPRQLWASGCLRNFHSPNAGIRDVFDPDIPPNLNTYGDDPEAPLPGPDSDEGGVLLPAVILDLSSEIQTSLEENFNAMHDDNNYGINIYLQVREFLQRITGENQ